MTTDDSHSLASESIFDDDRSQTSNHAPSSEEDKQQKSVFTWGHDTKKVFFWMMVVLSMIGITAAIVLTFTYTNLSSEEENQFRNGVSETGHVYTTRVLCH